MDLPRCKSCQRPILWLQHHESRQRMPVDPDPDPKGNILVSDDGTTYEVREPGSVPDLHLSHFATCSSAAKHRGKGRKT